MSARAHFDDAFVPLARAQVAWEELDGEAVVYEPLGESLHRLNATATAVWVACDGTASVASIASAISLAYVGDAAEIAQQVRELVRGFGDLGLLEGVEPLVAPTPVHATRPDP